MTDMNADKNTPDTTRRLTSLFIGTSVALALGGAGYASSVLFSGGDLGATSQTPLVAAANAISALAALSLAVMLPVVLAARGLPKWVAGITALGLGYLGAFAFVLLTAVPHFAVVSDDPALFISESLWMDAMGWPKQVLLLVGFVAIAVTGHRRRIFGWLLTTGLVAAGIVNALLWPYAPGAIISGIVLAILAHSLGRKSDRIGPTAKMGSGTSESERTGSR